MTATLDTFRCMMCGYEFQELVEKGEDKERICAKCRSNSIRHFKPKRVVAKEEDRARAAN